MPRGGRRPVGFRKGIGVLMAHSIYLFIDRKIKIILTKNTL
jgi:hypothetical protein